MQGALEPKLDALAVCIQPKTCRKSEKTCRLTGHFLFAAMRVTMDYLSRPLPICFCESGSFSLKMSGRTTGVHLDSPVPVDASSGHKHVNPA